MGTESEAPDASMQIIFRGKDGSVLTEADLMNASETVNWELRMRTPVPDEANALHQQGRAAGAAGRNDEALDLFKRAARLAPEWPYPTYDAAFTYLLKGDDARALEYYLQTLRLAPRGFFTAITAAHYLGIEANGGLPRGTYLAYLSLEWVSSPDEKRTRAEALTKKVPRFAPAWKELAWLLHSKAERLAAIDRGLDADPDAETRGFLLINRATLLAERGDRDGAISILGDLATNASQPIDIHQIARFSLASMTREP